MMGTSSWLWLPGVAVLFFLVGRAHGQARPFSLMEPIQRYVAANNANLTTLEHDLCSRRYLIAPIHCRSSVGNEFMMFLNNLAIGIITNRTLLLHEDESCENKVVFAPWIPRFEKVTALLSRQCNISTYTELNFIDEEDNSASPITLACCDIDTAHESIQLLKYNRLDRMQASVLGLEGARVSSLTAKNALDIFAIPGKGPLYGYGQLFHATIKFAKTVTRWNEHFLLQLKHLTNTTAHNVTVLGAHLRHQQPEDQGKLQGYEAMKTLECIKQLLPSTRKDYCVIILATDRMHTLVEVERWAKTREIMCQFMHSASSHEGNKADFGLAGKPDKAYSRDEHGPWGDGLLVFTDMHLLAQANVFVGSKGLSTYASSLSILYGSTIAGKVGDQRLQTFPPSCSALAFNGEIFNGTLLHSDGKVLKPEPPPPLPDESTWRSLAEKKKGKAGGPKGGPTKGGPTGGPKGGPKGGPALQHSLKQAPRKSLYEKYVVEHPVIDCTGQLLKERCTYNLGRREVRI